MTVPIDIQDEDHFEELLGEACLRKNLYRVRWSPNSDYFLNNFHAVDTVRKDLQIFHDHARVEELSS